MVFEESLAHLLLRNNSNLFDPMLFQLVVKVCVRETALRPVLIDNDVALLRLEIIVKRPAPRIFGKSLALARGNLCGGCMLPLRVIARFPTVGSNEMDPPLCGSAAMSHNAFTISEPIEPQE